MVGVFELQASLNNTASAVAVVCAGKYEKLLDRWTPIVHMDIRAVAFAAAAVRASKYEIVLHKWAFTVESRSMVPCTH